VGSSRDAAEQIRREIERRLSLGIFDVHDETPCPTLAEYTKHWLSSHVRPNLKPSTAESYERIVHFHLLPSFGDLRLTAISRVRLKSYLADLAKSETRARNTVRNVIAAFRALLNHAVEDGIIQLNPAVRLCRFNLSKGRGRRVDFLTPEEVASFLETAKQQHYRRYPFFFTAVRSGLRLGELLGLQWDDIQFGAGEDDRARYILVRHNIVRGQATSPKNRKTRRVDLSRELRRVLLELRDQQTLKAIERGDFDERDQPRLSKLVFPSTRGEPLNGRNIYHRDFLPCLQAAGLRRVTFHALRHTFASMLIQQGASLVYVKEQMGHSSIQVTVDTYGHLIPSGNIEWVDALDAKTSPQQSATPAQPRHGGRKARSSQVVEKTGRPGEIRTPDPRFRKPLLYPSELQARVASMSLA
jgi:integrase